MTTQEDAYTIRDTLLGARKHIPKDALLESIEALTRLVKASVAYEQAVTDDPR